MWEAWSKRDSREVWKIARRLAGKNKGPKRSIREFNALPSEPELLETYTKPGNQGGILAEKIDWRTFCEDRIGFYQKDAPIVAPPPAVTTAGIKFVTAQPPDPQEESIAMFAAEFSTIESDKTQTAMVVEWLKDGDVFEDYILSDPESELRQQIGDPCRHGNSFCLICFRAILKRAEDIHFINILRHEFAMRAQAANQSPVMADDPPPLDVWSCPDRQLARRTTKFARQLRYQCRTGKIGKATPEWALPRELWRLVSEPHHFRTRGQFSVDSFATAGDKIVSSRTDRAYLDLIASGLKNERLPINCSRSVGFRVPKTNGYRLVHSLCPFGKDFIRTVIRDSRRTPPKWAFGGYKRRRREGAVMQQACLRWRLRNAHISHLGRSYDVRNAFASPNQRSIIDSMCSNFRDPSSVAPFVEQRVTEAVTTTNVVGGQVTMHHSLGGDARRQYPLRSIRLPVREADHKLRTRNRGYRLISLLPLFRLESRCFRKVVR